MYAQRKMKKILLFGIFLTSLNTFLFSQNAVKEDGRFMNPRQQVPLGVNFGYWGTIVGLEVEAIGISYFVLPQIEFETDLGLVNYKQVVFTVSTKFHANKNHSRCGLTPFAGLTLGMLQNEGGVVKTPIGLNYLSRFGLNLSGSLGLIFATSGYNDIFLEFKLGWHFYKSTPR